MIISSSSCKKLIEIESPKNQLTSDKILLDSLTANSVMVSSYAKFDRYVIPLIGNYMSVYTDELINPNLADYSQSRLMATSNSNLFTWSYLYEIIYQSNDLIERLPENITLTPTLKRSLLGESQFMRALCYFYLLQLYQKVPLITSTSVSVNRTAVQASQEEIYGLILQDLRSAKENLNASYTGSGRVRANQYAARALLARVYLYRQQYEFAEVESTAVINSGLYSPLASLAEVFKAGSKESILQLWNQNGFIAEGASTIPSTAVSVPTYSINPELYSSFESADQRKASWIGLNTVIENGAPRQYPYLFKYKNRAASSSPEYLTLLRISEQYLIRSEARARQNKLTGTDGALIDLNTIRTRAGLPTISTTDPAEILKAIALENRHEFFGEFAFRFTTLKRTGEINAVMSALKPTWISSSAVLPIPQTELSANPILKQNPGY